MKEKKKPERTEIFCPSCGKELAEHELFFGLCKCKHPVGVETQPADRINKIIDKAIDDTINDL